MVSGVETSASQRGRVVVVEAEAGSQGNGKDFGGRQVRFWGEEPGVNWGGVDMAQAVERSVGRAFGNVSKFCGDFRTGQAGRSELGRFGNWVCEETAARRRRLGLRSRKKDGVSFLASSSVQSQSFLASTAVTFGNLRWRRHGTDEGVDGTANSLSVAELLKHPIALVSLVPKELSLFLAGAVAGAAAKTFTAPLDRVKLIMQVHGVQAAEAGIKRGIGFLEAMMMIGTQEGVKGYWKGNLPQVIRVIPYSAVQLFAYETYKRILKGDQEELSVGSRLVAGACAGMTSTLVTYPLDVLRLRMAVDPACKSMGQVAVNMMKEEGLAAFYRGLGPSLLGIAPYIALNFCVFDLVKKSLPEDFRTRPEASFVTALCSATFATLMCYPLDTVRRQLQMKSTPFKSVADAIPGIIARDGIVGLYRGFVPNALKNLPTSSIRLTTFDAAKNLISKSQQEYDRLVTAQQQQSTAASD